MNQSQATFLTKPAKLEAPIESIVASAQRGDAEAFADLYDANAPMVYALCLRMVADTGLAEELVQSVFIRVWKRIGTFRAESKFTTWLHRITVNEVLQNRRASRRRSARIALVEDLPPGNPEAAAKSSDPGLSMDLEKAVAELTGDLRDVFVLHDIQGVPHAEIAEMLSIPIGTCRSHLFRARRVLREALS